MVFVSVLNVTDGFGDVLFSGGSAIAEPFGFGTGVVVVAAATDVDVSLDVVAFSSWRCSCSWRCCSSLKLPKIVKFHH